MNQTTKVKLTELRTRLREEATNIAPDLEPELPDETSGYYELRDKMVLVWDHLSTIADRLSDLLSSEDP